MWLNYYFVEYLIEIFIGVHLQKHRVNSPEGYSAVSLLQGERNTYFDTKTGFLNSINIILLLVAIIMCMPCISLLSRCTFIATSHDLIGIFFIIITL